MAFDSYDMESLYTLFAKKKCPYNLRSLIHKNICLQLQTSFFKFFFQPYSRTAVWHLGVRPPNGVTGHRVLWPAAKEFQWEPGLFSCREKRQCWDVTGKWSKRKCARPLSASVKVCTLVSKAAYTAFSGPPECIGTWGLVPRLFFGRLVNPNSIIIGILWPPHRLVPTKIFDIPVTLLCTPYLICTYTKSKMNGVSCWL